MIEADRKAVLIPPSCWSTNRIWEPRRVPTTRVEYLLSERLNKLQIQLTLRTPAFGARRNRGTEFLIEAEGTSG